MREEIVFEEIVCILCFDRLVCNFKVGVERLNVERFVVSGDKRNEENASHDTLIVGCVFVRQLKELVYFRLKFHL